MTLTRMMEIATRYAKRKRTDSAVARANQSARTPEEVIPIGSKSAKPSPRVLERLQL